MKRVLPSFLLLLLSLFAFPQLSPRTTNLAERKTAFQQLLNDSTAPRLNYVNDFENIFTVEQVRQLDSLLSHFQQQSNFEIVLVTIDTGFLQGGAFDSIAYLLARRWGIGGTIKSNGVVINVSKGSGRIRIYNGYNISAILSYQDTKLLIDLDFLPFYKKKEYYEGTVNGLTELMKMLTKGK